MNHINDNFDTSGMEESERLNLSDVVGFIDYAKRRPQMLRNNVGVVDPLENNLDNIVNQAMHVLNTDLGSSGPRGQTTVTQRSLVLHGWRLHYRLSRRAAQLRIRATALVVGSATAMVLSTILAICSISLQTQKEEYGEDVVYNTSVPVENQVVVMQFSLADESRVLRILILALPMVAGILTGLLGQLQVQQKWSAVRMAACRTESEIYMLLGGIGPYHGSTLTTHKKFMTRLMGLLKLLSMSGCNEEVVDGVDDGWPQANGELEQHINEHVYGIPPVSCGVRFLRCCGEVLHLISPCCSPFPNNLEADSIDPIATLIADSYMQVRVQPLRRYYSKWGTRILITRIILHGLLVICLSLCSGLSAFGFTVLVPTMLAVAAFFATVIQWLVPAHLLTALNCASTTLTNLDLRWKGTEFVQNLAQSSRTGLIQTTEKVNWAVCASLTGAFTVSYGFDLDENDEFQDDPFLRTTSRSETRGLNSRTTSRTTSGMNTPNPYSRSRTHSGMMTPLNY